MFAVIFEVQPKPERWNDYLDTARMLRPELERIEGFIDNEYSHLGRYGLRHGSRHCQRQLCGNHRLHHCSRRHGNKHRERYSFSSR